jgi:hypothetical protein
VQRYKEIPKFSQADILCAVEKVWGVGGVETPAIPDEPDALDAGDVVEGRDPAWKRTPVKARNVCSLI